MCAIFSDERRSYDLKCREVGGIREVRSDHQFHRVAISLLRESIGIPVGREPASRSFRSCSSKTCADGKSTGSFIPSYLPYVKGQNCSLPRSVLPSCLISISSSPLPSILCPFLRPVAKQSFRRHLVCWDQRHARVNVEQLLHTVPE